MNLVGKKVVTMVVEKGYKLEMLLVDQLVKRRAVYWEKRMAGK